MTMTCQLCDSKAVVDKSAALGGALLVHLTTQLLDADPAETTNPHPQDHLLQALRRVFDAAQTSRALLDDIARFQFGEIDWLCLRCGARFDTPTE